MGVSNLQPQTAEFTFPRKLDNCKLVSTEEGVKPVLFSVPCDIDSVAAVDWVTFSFGVETGDHKYLNLDPEFVEAALTDWIETYLDQLLFEIFGFGGQSDA